MAILLRFLRNLPGALLSPIAVIPSLTGLLLADLLWRLFGRRLRREDTLPGAAAASVVIPNWNGRDLLEKYLPSVIEAMAGNPRNEIIVVDNGSTDGSADFVRARFPTVRLLALPRNLGFGGGSNAGFRAASNDIVVLLNSDMRVAPDFLAPLLEGFGRPDVFAVSCQIFFSDASKKREETGLTQGWWENGGLRVRHYDEDRVHDLYPCFYGGGGSCAFDRRKFLELGGFDELLRPFYLEDADLGYLAWKRGWRVLYQPNSRVWHEHRGTIGKKFSPSYIDAVIRKNLILFCWKNIHEPARLLEHFFFAWSGAFLSLFAGDSLERSNFGAIWRAFVQLPRALRSRWRGRSLAEIDDAEAFRRPLGGYYRDRFESLDPNPDRLKVLMVCPYPLSPPIHGGAVFMNQAVKHLGRLVDLHLVVMVDYPKEIDAHAELIEYTASMEFLIRLEGQPKGLGAITPFAVREFRDQELEWKIHRIIATRNIDVVQLEYTNMGQYAGPYRQLAWVLFEHDVYFQSIWRQLPSMRMIQKPKAFLEYLRALRYEIRTLPRLDRVQVCTAANRDFLLSFVPELEGRIDHDVRAGIDTSLYEYAEGGREPFTLLFLGSFRHTPNQVALKWLLDRVMPRILISEPRARLKVAGSDPPAAHTMPTYDGAVELLGFVPEVQEPLRRYSIFLCPILSGSGVRVKLLEAFAAGIPCVSTRIGAEGLTKQDGEFCALADSPEEFADAVLRLMADPAAAAAMARRARRYVEREWDMAVLAGRLEASYRRAISAKRPRP
jgi:GT2 family glycosyltransferase/glycosyltransferase involved in cell wall biosynthesis